jgi:hypothetical protein
MNSYHYLIETLCGARAPLRRVVAQTQPGDMQREGESLGGAGPVLASHLSYPWTPDIPYSRGRGGMSVQKGNP